MTTTLRQVLAAFENTHRPRTLNQLARELELPLGMLEGMIDYWVRKGKLRESSAGQGCATCGGAQGCPFVPHLPRTYELVTDDNSPIADPSCCGGCR